VFFNRTWKEFKEGFGDVSGDYWIGNDRLHSLTKDGNYRLRVDVQTINDCNWQWAEYDTFIVDDESTGFMLHVSGFSGTAYNSLLSTGLPTDPGNLNGMRFSTFDNRNPITISCAAIYRAGFWYNRCSYVHINSDGAIFKWWSGDELLQTSRMALIPLY
jgi:Fibrinogen beta and gamma chains, C-terminal globular domain